MKTKDLVYVGAIALIGFLLLRKKPLVNSKQKDLIKGGTSISDNIPNGGLNLGKNMDLPNLTPTPKNGLPTEVALNNSNVKPIIKEDNEPTQIFIKELPDFLKPKGTSNIAPSPIDIIPLAPIEPKRDYPIYEPIKPQRPEIFDNPIDYPVETPRPQRPIVIDQEQPISYPIDYRSPVEPIRGYPIYDRVVEPRGSSIIEEPIVNFPIYYGSPIETPRPQRPIVIDQEQPISYPIDYRSPVEPIRGYPIYEKIQPIESFSSIKQPFYLDELLPL